METFYELIKNEIAGKYEFKMRYESKNDSFVFELRDGLLRFEQSVLFSDLRKNESPTTEQIVYGVTYNLLLKMLKYKETHPEHN